MTTPDDAEELEEMIEDLAADGVVNLHVARGSDYFAFGRGTWRPAPSVAIGRAGYDNVLIADCLRRRIPVVDATLSARVYHQYHDYGHVGGGKEEIYLGDEAKRNTSLLPPGFKAHLESASFRLEGNKLVKNYARGNFLRFLHLLFRQKGNRWLFRGLDRVFWKGVRCLRLDSAKQYTLADVLRQTQTRLYAK